MIDPKQQAEMEQGMAVMVEFYPPLWRRMFLSLVKEGFTEQQSLELVKTYVMALCGKGPAA